MIPAGRRSSGFLLALADAEAKRDTGPLTQWLRANAGISLDAGEAEAFAAFLDDLTLRCDAHRPRTLSPQDVGRIIAAVRAFDRLPATARRGAFKRLTLDLAAQHRISARTVQALARKARQIKAPPPA